MPTSDEEFRRVMVERLVKLEDKVELLERGIRRINTELGPGLPEPDERAGRLNLRSRVHTLENDKAAERIARSALSQATEAKNQEWSTMQKIGLFAFAAAAAASSIARMFGIGV